MKINKTLIGIVLCGMLSMGCENKNEAIEKEVYRKSLIETKEGLKNLQEAIEDWAVSYAVRNDKGLSIYYPDSLDELKEYTEKPFLLEDGWGNGFNYRSFSKGSCTILVRMEGKKVIYSDTNYELSSSGPDGIPCTSDDIQAWYKSSHEWGSTERLQRAYNEAIK